ncbi:MAG: peptidyl-tRNA hydrolase, PTH1 family [Parcubacteria group bacterium Gr01-1014_44]|nr:MAG: peptidyl-tRNA hydrolase, PTH1 family [Parcubacteria group bacterium Gr01-1014_44]
MYLIIGLGNPDKEYSETRHNSGFLFLDFLAKEIKASDFQPEKKLLAETANGKLNGEKIILAKPQTFVNKSGEAVKKIKTFYKIPVENILIVHDDLDVPFGSIKFSSGSGAGGHKGIKSIIGQLKTEKISRLKIGLANSKLKIARGQKLDEKRKEMIAGFVLSKFTPGEKTKLKEIFQEGLKKIEQWI